MPDGLDPQQNSPQAPASPPAWSQNVTTGAPAAESDPAPPKTLEFMPPTMKPDGGVLGKAVIGSLEAASDAQNPPPKSLEFVPQSMEFGGGAANTPPQPTSWWDKAHDFAQTAINQIPFVGEAHMLAEAGSAYGHGRAQEREQANLVATAQGKQSPYSTIGTLALRAMADYSDLEKGASSPEGMALGGAAMVPGLNVVVGTGLVGHGLYNGIIGWGDLMNPDILQNELNSAAETLGGATGVTEGVKGLHQAYQNKMAMTPDEQYIHFKNAVPPTKTAPYTEMDYQAVRPYLDAAHTTGTPIDGIQSTVDAAESAIDKIEGKVAAVIKANPDEPVTFKDATGGRAPIDPITDAATALQGSVRKDFLAEGLKELEKYPLDPTKDGPLTLERADDIRRQLNDDNRSLMKAKNNIDIANMTNTDPAFAARQAAAESLRSGIYNTLGDLGLKDARAMRLDEGSLIKIRNAAQRQVFNAEKAVKTAAKPSLAKKVAKKAAVGVGAAAGFELGSKVGHPLIGSAIGAEMGSEASEALTPKALTRDELIQKAFEPIVKPQPVQTNGAGLPGVVAGQVPKAPAGFLHVQASDKNEYYIPESQLNHAREVDPGLQILNPQPAAPPQ